MSSPRPQRILHVLGGLTWGGVETWLMHVLKHIERHSFQMDFLVHTTEPCVYDAEARALGSAIIPCLAPHKPWLYAHNFRRIMREHGPYDVVHSHVHHYSGYILRLAKQAGVPIRIAHCHSDTLRLQANAGLARRMYLRVTERWIASYATLGLSASKRAAGSLFGPRWEADPRWRVHHCGIDLAPFEAPPDRRAVRAELGIPADALVIGHAGAFTEPKNHLFLIAIAAEIARRVPHMRLLLVGDGPLRAEIEHTIAQLQLADRVIFTGMRRDVPRLMAGAMDVLLFPSLYEGLPVVGIEAQAAGLPFVLSDVITDEVDVVQPLVRRLSLAQSPAAWAEAVLTMRQHASTIDAAGALATLRGSSFNITHSVTALKDMYAHH